MFQEPIIIGRTFFTPSDSLHYTRFLLDFHMQNSQKNKKIIWLFCTIKMDMVKYEGITQKKVCDTCYMKFI